MANNGPNSNGSQFFITTGDAAFLDEKHVAFGQLLEGNTLLGQIEAEGSTHGRPKNRVEITRCGRIE